VWWGVPTGAGVAVGVAPLLYGLGSSLYLGPRFEGAPLAAVVAGVVAVEAPAVWAWGGGFVWHPASP